MKRNDLSRALVAFDQDSTIVAVIELRLRSRGIEAYVIHASSFVVSREHRRAKTDRLDTETLMRAFLSWLRGEVRHGQMAAIPTVAQEDAKRPSREHENQHGQPSRSRPAPA